MRLFKRILTLALMAPLCGCGRRYGDTDEFRAFVKLASQYESAAKTETDGDYTYKLENGKLSFIGGGGEIWSSDPFWYVDGFRLFDVDGDGATDCLFSLWKSYSFYKGAGAPNDDKSVKNHLFLYTIRGGYAKPIWCSSNLPRRICGFGLYEGTPTRAYSGVVLKTEELPYTEDLSVSGAEEYVYTWQGWGFVPE